MATPCYTYRWDEQDYLVRWTMTSRLFEGVCGYQPAFSVYKATDDVDNASPLFTYSPLGFLLPAKVVESLSQLDRDMAAELPRSDSAKNTSGPGKIIGTAPYAALGPFYQDGKERELGELIDIWLRREEAQARRRDPDMNIIM